MIIFNNAGHCFVSAPVSQDPIVWVDAQDISTYTLGSASGLGNELIVNGDFATDSDWNLGDGWFISGGVLNCDNSGSGNRNARQDDILTIGKTYRLTFDCTVTSGTLFFIFGGTQNITQSGSYEFILNVTGTDFIFRNSSGNFIGSIDNVSVEVLAYDVTNLDNKGSLGGVMTLNGSVKFANGGFESWSNSDYINYNLNEPFLTNNSFTVVTTFKLNTNNSNTKLFSSVYGDDNNSYSAVYDDSLIYQVDYRGSQDSKFEDSESSVNGLQTLIYTINNIGNRYAIKLMSSGSNSIELDTEAFDNVNDAVVYLLNDVFIGANSGIDNPLHEFRLYNRAMSLVEMQDLQTELNNKYLILGNELVVNGDFSNGLNGWNFFGSNQVNLKLRWG